MGDLRKAPGIRDFLTLRNASVDNKSTSVALLSIERERFFRELMKDDKYQSPKNLNRFEFQVFSQAGDDGILLEIFSRIGSGNKSFVEMGVGNGLENNTTFFLMQEWSGLWVDGNPTFVADIKTRFTRFIQNKKLNIVESFITAENINDILDKAGCPEEPDLFSLDIDQNTYWVLKALKNYRPRVMVIEYNAFYPPTMDFVVPYDPNKIWDGSINYSASIRPFVTLADEMGYNIVACDTFGVNMFFVRKDLCEDKFQEPYTAEFHFEPYRLYQVERTHLHPPGV
jgi:hypothetical protein